MGVSSRDYMYDRPVDHGGFGRAPWTFWMAVVIVPLWLISAISTRSGTEQVSQFLMDFTLRSDAVGSRPWTVLTTHFLHHPDGIRHILWNVILWLQVGREVETARGSKALWTVAALGALTSVVVYLASASAGVALTTVPSAEVLPATVPFELSVGMLGLDGILFALLGALTLWAPMPTLMLLGTFHVRTRPFAIVAAVATFTLTVATQTEAPAALLGYPLCFGAGLLFARLSMARPAPRSVSAPRPSVPEGTSEPPPVPSEEEDLRGRLDALLAKISAVGMEGLDEEERAFLEAASKRLRRDG